MRKFSEDEAAQLIGLLRNIIDEWGEYDVGDAVNGADLVEWVHDYRVDVMSTFRRLGIEL